MVCLNMDSGRCELKPFNARVVSVKFDQRLKLTGGYIHHFHLSDRKMSVTILTLQMTMVLAG